MRAPCYVGVAGWSLPKRWHDRFPAEGTHLQRYAARLPAVEINSSFYRPHRPATYARWGTCVPPEFRFAAKIPKTITHERRLVDALPLLDAFLAEVTHLGPRLGCLLVQLPPSLAYDPHAAPAFLAALRERHAGALAIEPRHPTWFEDDAVARMLASLRVARVAADPMRVPAAGEPGGWEGLEYHRLHGSPRMYYDNYDDAYLDALAARLRAAAARADEVWCIFDNTALDAATANALDLLARLGR